MNGLVSGLLLLGVIFGLAGVIFAFQLAAIALVARMERRVASAEAGADHRTARAAVSPGFTNSEVESHVSSLA